VIHKDATDVVPCRYSLVANLSQKNVDDSLVKVHTTSEWQVEDLLLRLDCAERYLVFIGIRRQETLIFDDAVCVFEPTYEINNSADTFANVLP
jgi:hypothetical protein